MESDQFISKNSVTQRRRHHHGIGLTWKASYWGKGVGKGEGREERKERQRDIGKKREAGEAGGPAFCEKT